MKHLLLLLRHSSLLLLVLGVAIHAQNPAPPSGRPPGFGPGGPQGFGPGPRVERKILNQFDADSNGRLSATERQAARAELARNPVERRGPRGPGGGRFETGKPGPRISPSDITPVKSTNLFDLGSVRTLFLQFENDDWEKELADFHNTDVEVPATLSLDGKTYPEVGISFRGMSSYSMVPAGLKRPLNVSIDFANDGQNILGHRTLNLLNANGDPSFVRSALFSRIANEYIPTPHANFVQVVINGESWGLYVQVEQFNKDFTKARFKSKGGVRWKVPGSPGGRGSLGYLGDDPTAYRGIYELKTKETPKSWNDLIRLCRILDSTPAADLPAALEPILDVQGALAFLALDNALMNSDGYWVRTSDYSLFQDDQGRFHLVPHDFNETFSLAGGRGGGGRRGGPGGPGGPQGPGNREGFEGPGGPRPPGGAPGEGPGQGRRGGSVGGGIELDPLFAANDPSKVLLYRLLAVPAYRTRYMELVRDIATRWLDWEKIGPDVEAWHRRITPFVETDTRKLDSFEAFTASLSGDPSRYIGRPGPGTSPSLKSIIERRRTYLLGPGTTNQN